MYMRFYQEFQIALFFFVRFKHEEYLSQVY